MSPPLKFPLFSNPNIHWHNSRPFPSHPSTGNAAEETPKPLIIFILRQKTPKKPRIGEQGGAVPAPPRPRRRWCCASRPNPRTRSTAGSPGTRTWLRDCGRKSDVGARGPPEPGARPAPGTATGARPRSAHPRTAPGASSAHPPRPARPAQPRIPHPRTRAPSRPRTSRAVRAPGSRTGRVPRAFPHRAFPHRARSPRTSRDAAAAPPARRRKERAGRGGGGSRGPGRSRRVRRERAGCVTGGAFWKVRGRSSVAGGRRERAEAARTCGSVAVLSRSYRAPVGDRGWRSGARRYGGDSRSGALPSGPVRGQPGGLEPVRRRGRGRREAGGGRSLPGEGREWRSRVDFNGFLFVVFQERGWILTGFSLLCSRSAQVPQGNQRGACPAAPSGE